MQPISNCSMMNTEESILKLWIQTMSKEDRDFVVKHLYEFTEKYKMLIVRYHIYFDDNETQVAHNFISILQTLYPEVTFMIQYPSETELGSILVRWFPGAKPISEILLDTCLLREFTAFSDEK